VAGDGKVQQKSVKLAYVDEAFSVVDGLDPGARVVVEGAQNLRPGSAVAEADRSGPGAPAEEAAKAEGRKRKAAGAKPA